MEKMNSTITARNHVRVRWLIRNKYFSLTIWWITYFSFLLVCSYLYRRTEMLYGHEVYGNEFPSPEEWTWGNLLISHLLSTFLITLGMFLVSSFGLIMLKANFLGRDSAIAYSIYVCLILVLSSVPPLLYIWAYRGSVWGIIYISPPAIYLGTVITALAVSGFFYLLKVLEKNVAYAKASRRLKILSGKLQAIQEKLKRTEGELQSIVYGKNHIKIGNKCKYQFIFFDKIAYIGSHPEHKGKGEPFIFLIDGTCQIGDRPLKEFKKLLPDTDFIQVHKSFIISKRRVIKRERDPITKSDKLILQLENEKVPIRVGNSFKYKVDKDSTLGWGYFEEEE